MNLYSELGGRGRQQFDGCTHFVQSIFISVNKPNLSLYIRHQTPSLVFSTQ